MPLRYVRDLRPNPYNRTLFDKSLQEDDPGLIYLTEDIHRDGLRNPIFCRPDGMIIDGERRWRAINMLGWETVETIEKDVPDNEVLDYIVRSVSSSRQSSLREQARIYLAYKMHLKATTRLPQHERKVQAMQRAHFPFSDTYRAEQVVTIFSRADPIIQDKLVHDEISVQYAYSSMTNTEYPLYARPRVRGPYRKAKPSKLQAKRLERDKARREALKKEMAALDLMSRPRNSGMYTKKLPEALPEEALPTPETLPTPEVLPDETLPELQKEMNALYDEAAKDPDPDEVDIITGEPATFNEYRLDPIVERAFESIPEPDMPARPKPVTLEGAFDEALQRLWMTDKPETTLLRLMRCFVSGVTTVHGQDSERAKAVLRDSFTLLRPLLQLDAPQVADGTDG